MNYADARSMIRSGDLLLFRGTGPAAWLVRKWTDSPYSHVGLAWCVGDRVLILESRPRNRGVTINRALSQALGDGPTWVPTGVVWRGDMQARALDRLGTPYGWLDAIRAGLGIRTVGGGVECAEYVFRVLGIHSQVKETPAALADQFRLAPFRPLSA